MQWIGINQDGREIDLSLLPCAPGLGISDCWPCYKFPELKSKLRDALEIALSGRTEVLVRSRYLNGMFYSLNKEDISVDWF